MKKSTLLYIVLLLFLTVLTGCNKDKPCPKVIYPTLQALDKVPRFTILIKDGRMASNSTRKSFMGIKALRVSEQYYYNLVKDYRKSFNNTIPTNLR